MRSVPKATLQRYPIYLKALNRLEKNGIERVMSKELALMVDIEPTTIRRDFSFLGNLSIRAGFSSIKPRLYKNLKNDLIVDIFLSMLDLESSLS